MTPYNTGKVQIGLLYRQPMPQDDDPDMMRLQSALVGRNKRLVANWRADLTNTITEAVLWTLSIAVFIAIPYTPSIWRLITGD